MRSYRKKESAGKEEDPGSRASAGKGDQELKAAWGRWSTGRGCRRKPGSTIISPCLMVRIQNPGISFIKYSKSESESRGTKPGRRCFALVAVRCRQHPVCFQWAQCCGALVPLLSRMETPPTPSSEIPESRLPGYHNRAHSGTAHIHISFERP